MLASAGFAANILLVDLELADLHQGTEVVPILADLPLVVTKTSA